MRTYNLRPVIWDIPRDDPLQGAALKLLERIRGEVPWQSRLRIVCGGVFHGDIGDAFDRFDEFRYRLGGSGGPLPLKPGEISAWNRAFRLIKTTIYPTGRGPARGFKFVMDLQRMRLFLPVALGLGALGYLARHQQAEGAEAVFGA